jgi:hypothetical protein
MPYKDKQKKSQYDALRYASKSDEERLTKNQANAKWRRENADKVNEYNRKYRKQNMKEYFRMYKAKQRQEPQHLMCKRLRNRMHKLLAGKEKSATTMELIGCSREELIAYLESLFEPGMTWEQRRRFHIDHIRPCCSFDLTDPKQQKECFHFTNLRPLWASDNLTKGGKYDR